MNTDVSKDEAFQQRYLNTYKSRGARIRQSTLKQYFELMEAEKESVSLNLRRLYLQLFGEYTSIRLNHVAFVTQMMNLINDTYPVIDSGLAYTFGFEEPTQSRMSMSERIHVYEEFYTHLRMVYKEVISERMIYDLLKVFEITLKREGRKV
ncbi:MAG: hypothetical protein D6730_03085, partial [Bacteroidetes bacterium]